jgi:hypothetical protein
LLILVNVLAVWRLIGREGSAPKCLRHVLPLMTAVLAFAFAGKLAGVLLPLASEGWSPAAWQVALLWCFGATSILLLTWLWRRLGVEPSELSLAAFGSLAGFLLPVVLTSGAGVRQLGLPQAPFILVGLGCLLHVLAVHTKAQGAWGTAQRSVLGAAVLLSVFAMLAHLPGAGVSLFWALAAMLTFVIGHLLATRSLRMIGLLGLGVATVRVLSHDITDMLGRIAACAAVAVAFFGIAWLYGRITAEKQER